MSGYSKADYSDAAISAANFQGTNISGEYINKVIDEINNLNERINFTGVNFAAQKPNTAGGFIAEEWHSGTFNIDSAIKDKKLRAVVPSSNTLGSEDIILSSGQSYSSKYYSDSTRSAKSQSTSHSEHYLRNVKGVSFEKWMEINNLDPNLSDISIYEGQGRIIPSDQLIAAKKYLEKKIKKEATLRPELVEKYKETLEQLGDRIKAEGVESRKLSKSDSSRIAVDSREGNYSVEKDGITEKQLLTDNQSALIKKSLKTGLTAASITIALEMTPELIKIIKLLAESEGYELTDFIDKLGESGKKGTDSFLLGSISSYIIISSEAGILGDAFKKASSEQIAATALILYNSIKVSANYVKGNISKNEMAYQISSYTIGVIGSSIGSIAFQFMPVIGTVVGSMVGSIIANTIHYQVNSMMLGIAISNGCAFFGLVDHSYELPEEVLEELGVDLINHFETNLNNFEFDVFEFHNIDYDEIDYDEMDLVFIKRGVVGVNKIGYV